MSLIKGLHHAALRCCGKAEMDSVIEFYCRVLGMKRLRIFKQTLGIEGVHVYTTFQTINQWGWDGKIL